MRVRTASALIAAFISTSVLAQASIEPAGAEAQPAAAPWRSTPKPSPDAKRWVELLIGRATAKDARFVQDGKEYRGKVKFDCARVAAGWGTSCKATYSLEGHAPMDEAYLLGWDPVKGQAHWFEVTSTGVVHDHAGAWTDDGTITVTHRGLNASGEEEVDTIALKKQPGSRLLLSADGKVGTRTLWSFRATLVYQATK